MPRYQNIEEKSIVNTVGNANLSKNALPIMYNTLEFFLTSPKEGKVLLCIKGSNVHNSMGRAVSLRAIEKEIGLPSSTLKSNEKGILPRLIKRGLIKDRTNTYELTGIGCAVVDGYYAFVNTLIPELGAIKSREPEISDWQKLKMIIKKT